MTDLDKKLHKRWGRKFRDIRDWQDVNGQLVRRGEILLAFDFVNGWRDELESMNEGKVGAPYRFPNTLIELQALWHALHLPYRMIEGMTCELAKLGHLPDYDDYSTVNRRVNELNFRLAAPQGENIVVFNDGSGMQAVNGGEYLREKYGKKNRRWIQVVLLGDAKTHQPVSFEINLIPSSESESTIRQVTQLLRKGVPITAVGGDGAMDDKDLWNFCNDQSLRPIIKPDKNARYDVDCPLRNQHIRERNRLGYKRWARKNSYGHRWTATEGIFSAIKRVFGEQIRATSETGMLHEAASKIWAYQRLQRA
jgi:hypothetical protein